MLLAGFLPFDEPTMSQLFRKIQAADFQYPTWFEDGVKALLDRILIIDPKDRATLADVKADAWFAAGGTAEGMAADMAEAEPSRTACAASAAATAAAAKAMAEGGGDGAADAAAPMAAGADAAAGAPAAAAPAASEPVTEGVAHTREEGKEDPSSVLAMKQSVHKMSRNSHFTATGTGQALLAPVQDALEKLGCAVAVRADEMRLKASRETACGQVTCTITLRNMDDGVQGSLRRGRGDIMQYNKFAKELFESSSVSGTLVPAAGPLEGWEENDESVIETPRPR